MRTRARLTVVAVVAAAWGAYLAYVIVHAVLGARSPNLVEVSILGLLIVAAVWCLVWCLGSPRAAGGDPTADVPAPPRPMEENTLTLPRVQPMMLLPAPRRPDVVRAAARIVVVVQPPASALDRASQRTDEVAKVITSSVAASRPPPPVEDDEYHRGLTAGLAGEPPDPGGGAGYLLGYGRGTRAREADMDTELRQLIDRREDNTEDGVVGEP